MVQELSYPIGESMFGTLLLVAIIILIDYACIRTVLDANIWNWFKTPLRKVYGYRTNWTTWQNGIYCATSCGKMVSSAIICGQTQSFALYHLSNEIIIKPHYDLK